MLPPRLSTIFFTCQGKWGQKNYAYYRKFVYEAGCLDRQGGRSIDADIMKAEQKKGFSPGRADRFLARSRYFTESGIIGSREFIRSMWRQLKGPGDNPDKKPVRIAGLSGIYSLKRLSENII
jgi:hypothetical protein